MKFSRHLLVFIMRVVSAVPVGVEIKSGDLIGK